MQGLPNPGIRSPKAWKKKPRLFKTLETKVEKRRNQHQTIGKEHNMFENIVQGGTWLFLSVIKQIL